MRKKLLLFLVALTVMCSGLVVPAYAHQGIAEPVITFDNPGDALIDGATAKNAMIFEGTNGDIYRTSAESEGKGNITLSSPEGYTGGQCIAVNQFTNYKSGIYYVPDTPLKNTIYFETDMFVAETADSKYQDRFITIYDGSTNISPVVFNDGRYVVVFGTYQKKDGVNIKYTPNTWYNIKVWYNLRTRTHKVVITDATGELLAGSTGVSSASGYDKNLSKIDKIEMYNVERTSITSSQTTYWDNIKVSTTYKLTNRLDFDTYYGPVTNTRPTAPVGSMYNFDRSATASFTSVTDQGRGTSLAITTDSSYGGMAAYFTSNISDPIKLNTSLKLPDMNTTRYVYVRAQTSTAGVSDSVPAFYFRNDGKFIYNGTVGFDYDVNTWYDITLWYDPSDASGKIKIMSDGRLVALYDGITFSDQTTIDTTIDAVYTRQFANGDSPVVMYMDNLSIQAMNAFAIDDDQSTTGEGIYCYADEPSVIKLTKPLADDATAESVMANLTVTQGMNDVNISDVILSEDKTTIYIDFAKECGKHYTIDAAGLVSVDGETLNDYIEFDISRPDLENTAITITGENGSYQASFTPTVNNNATPKMRYIIAVYEESADGAELAGVKVEEITLNSESGIQTINLAVNPGTNSNYTVKAFLWKPNSVIPMQSATIK